MTHSVWIVLFFVAIAIGYALGRQDGRRRQRRKLQGLSRNYMRGLNFLLNEQPDRAVDILVNSMDVNEYTVETHLALGRLFRKRGEMDRATRIHSHLLESGQLPADVREDVEMELARDYLAGGLFDRAEVLLQGMLDHGSRHAEEAMRLLLHIFEQEKDWNNALAVGERLARFDRGVREVLAHYCCELAERLMMQNELIAARRTLRRAVGYDRTCARASLLQGRLEMRQQKWEEALRAFRRIRRQDPDLFSEVLDDVERCYDALGQERELLDFLLECSAETPGIALTLKLAERLRRYYGEEEASRLIAAYIKAHPSVAGLDRMLELNLGRSHGEEREHLFMLKRLTGRLLDKQATWQCRQCGFESHGLYWQCPSCKHWGTVRPRSGLEGNGS